MAGYAHEQGKACIIAVNKWDAVEKDDKTMDGPQKKLMNDFSFMSYAPIIFISAKTGQRVDRLFQLIKYVDEQNAPAGDHRHAERAACPGHGPVQPPVIRANGSRSLYDPDLHPAAHLCVLL